MMLQLSLATSNYDYRKKSTMVADHSVSHTKVEQSKVFTFRDNASTSIIHYPFSLIFDAPDSARCRNSWTSREREK